MRSENWKEFDWRDYGEDSRDVIDCWTADAEIRRFACDGEWSREHAYYLTEQERYVDPNGNWTTHQYRMGVDFFSKVVFDDDTAVAALLLTALKGFPVSINSMIVNPALRGRGYGTAILYDLLNRVDILIPSHGDSIEAGIFTANTACIRIFEKNGFIRKFLHPDGDFVTYEYPLYCSIP